MPPRVAPGADATRGEERWQRGGLIRATGYGGWRTEDGGWRMDGGWWMEVRVGCGRVREGTKVREGTRGYRYGDLNFVVSVEC